MVYSRQAFVESALYNCVILLFSLITSLMQNRTKIEKILS